MDQLTDERMVLHLTRVRQAALLSAGNGAFDTLDPKGRAGEQAGRMPALNKSAWPKPNKPVTRGNKESWDANS